MMTLAVTFVLGLLAPVSAPVPLVPCAGAPQGRALQADVIAGRMFVHWHLRNGEDFRFYLDTGGNTWLYPESLSRLGAPIDSVVRNGYTVLRAHISSDLGDSLVLPVSRWPWSSSASNDTVSMLVSLERGPDFGIGLPVNGLLGSQWFADRVWVLDYLGQRLLFNDAMPTGPTAPECWVPLGFQVDPPTGQRTTHYPRIAARIDGEEIQFLLDTGARTTLTDTAWQVIGHDEPRQRATSFIMKSRFDEWHRHHPDWVVVLRAELGDSLPMIRVPRIQVGGQTIGPVWFTERPDRNFREFMSGLMDHPIEGALGGSAWKYVTLILDYPRARAAVLLQSR